MKEFLDYLKEECLPGLWSKGVALSRNSKSIEQISPADEKKELKYKIQTTERMLAFQVTLWPVDQDSYCNCDSKVEPCHHVVAVALAVDRGQVEAASAEPANDRTELRYSWIYESQPGQTKPKISLIRNLFIKGEIEELKTSLSSLLGGIQTGRVNSPLPSLSTLDLKIDALLADLRPNWALLLQAIQELPPLPLSGHPSLSTLKVNGRRERPSLIFSDHGEHSILLTNPEEELGLELEAGLFLKDGTLSERGLIPRVRTQVIHAERIPQFVREDLPKLQDDFQVMIQTKRLPRITLAEPELKLICVPLSENEISVTARIEYPLAQRNEILEKDLKKEGVLHHQLRDQLGLRADTPLILNTSRALELKQKLNQGSIAWKNTSSDLDTFLGNFLNHQGLSLEQALGESDSILRILKLKEKNKSGTPGLAKDFLKEFTKATGTDRLPTLPSVCPPALWKQLRDYQQTGVSWLNSRNEKLGGAILADDMGLGKTVQTLATLSGKSLVIAPTSLLQNWKQEAAHFRPDLKVAVFHGTNREWDENADLVITTYALLRSELKHLLSRKWDTIVLDEAHIIRNPETQSAIASTHLEANFRIALTGTPIQNRKRDLLSLFQFIAPDFFESEADLIPELISPYFLRRTKDEVLNELPPKTYTEHWIDFHPEEKRLYDSVFAAAKSEILSRLETQENLSPLSFFELLLRARQVCAHSGLILPEKNSQASSKTEALLELIEELIEAGHSVLVYSQWTSLLNLIERDLKGKVPYFRLDGSTQNRGAVVENFQNLNQSSVFLLSLHAGGVGLNLMKASHVIFCDPWWNPFVELQAEDRAYRMGQDKPVTIHRLLMNDSIEVQIRELQSSKRNLENEVFDQKLVQKLLR